MKYTFSDNINGLKPSAIREILKLSAEPGIIPFSAGNPSNESFPVRQIQKISKEILKKMPYEALQYSITEGYKPLRDFVLENLGQEGLVFGDDEVIITSGAQQSINLTAKALANSGDTVICEEPSFIGSLNAFRSFSLNLVGVPIEKDGMNISFLEEALKKNKNVRFIYTIPNFQNPSGVTMSLEKRKALYNLAREYNVIILEDNPYGALRFEGEEIPSIKSLDTDGRVIYAGSYSKVLAPGIRVGFAIANKEIISKMTVCKQTDDVHTNLWAQIVAHKFLTEYNFDAHLKKIREIYRKKAKLCIDAIEKFLVSKGISFFDVSGGLFVWCRLPEGIDMNEFCMKALENKVAVVPGSAFLVDETKKSDWFRINYSTPTDEQILKGIEILSKLL